MQERCMVVWCTQNLRRDGSSFTWHQPCQRCKYTTSVDIQKSSYKKLVTHTQFHASSESLLESGEWRYIIAINNHTKAWAVSQHIKTSKNTKAWAVSQHIKTSKNTKAWAVSQHINTSKNIKAWGVSQHINTSKNIKAWAV